MIKKFNPSGPPASATAVVCINNPLVIRPRLFAARSGCPACWAFSRCTTFLVKGAHDTLSRITDPLEFEDYIGGSARVWNVVRTTSSLSTNVVRLYREKDVDDLRNLAKLGTDKRRKLPPPLARKPISPSSRAPTDDADCSWSKKREGMKRIAKKNMIAGYRGQGFKPLNIR